MSALPHKPLLLIWGVHRDSEGYPNTRYRLQFLRGLQEFTILEIAAPATPPPWGNRLGKGAVVVALFSAAYAHLRILWRFLTLRTKPDVLYIPYPAVLALNMLYLVPQRLRPRKIIADAFISLHDTVVNDRKLLKPSSMLARVLFWLEQASYRRANLIIADTPQNADFMAREFQLDAASVIALPLSTDETAYQPQAYRPTGSSCRVLFIGTMIPLHGISTILAAAKILEKNRSIQFRMIGSGQESFRICEAMEHGASNLEWEENWLSAKQLAEEISQADICLGIFDAGDKAQRVCPYKLYAYSSIGRAVITAQTSWLHMATSTLEYEPFATVNAKDPEALAEQISNLLLHPEAREIYAANARKFYQDHLCNTISHQQLKALLQPSTN